MISKSYAVKDWTDFEFSAAKNEARRRSGEFILPIRLDETPLAGLRSDIAYLDYSELGNAGVVREVVAKLATTRESDPQASSSLSYATPSQESGPNLVLDLFFRRIVRVLTDFP